MFVVTLFYLYFYIYEKNIERFSLNSLFPYKYIRKNSYNISKKVLTINGQIDVAGYGNKIYSLVSALTIKIITNSEFISLWKQIDKFIEEPFPNTFYISKNIDYAGIINADTTCKPHMAYDWKIKKDIAKIVNKKLPKNYSIYYYGTTEAYFFELCTNKIYFEKFLENNLTSYKTIEEAEKSIILLF